MTPERAAQSAASEQRERAPRGAAFGLVLSPTSDRELLIDRFESRFRRLRKTVITSARLLRDEFQRGGFRHFLAMLTVTYSPGVEWKPYHITELQKRIRSWLRYRGHRYAYVWVCELQQRGVPHYHILIWVPHGLRLPKADLFGWWPHGSTNIQKVEKPIGYLIKYLSKVGDAIGLFRKGQRTHGTGGLDKNSMRERRWWTSPGYVRARWPDHSADVRRAPGGGWVAMASGEWMPSPWELVSFGPFGTVVRWRAGPNVGEYSAFTCIDA